MVGLHVETHSLFWSKGGNGKTILDLEIFHHFHLKIFIWTSKLILIHKIQLTFYLIFHHQEDKRGICLLFLSGLHKILWSTLFAAVEVLNLTVAFLRVLWFTWEFSWFGGHESKFPSFPFSIKIFTLKFSIRKIIIQIPHFNINIFISQL